MIDEIAELLDGWEDLVGELETEITRAPGVEMMWQAHADREARIAELRRRVRQQRREIDVAISAALGVPDD